MDLLKVTDKRPDAAIRALVDEVISTASRDWNLRFEGEYPRTGFGIGTLRPIDVKYTSATVATGMTSSIYWGASIAAASTWQDWFDVTTTEVAYLIITGVFCMDATPNITHIRPHVDGVDFPVINIEQIYTWDEAKGWFSKPFAVRPQKSFKMRIVGKTAGISKIGLLGYTVAKRSHLIQES
jgi:hypothetical protein